MARASRQPSRLALRLATEAAVDGRSVRALATAMGAPVTSVYRWRQADREMPLGAAADFARALGMRLEVVKLGRERTAPCGHKVLLPDPSRGYVVDCKPCETKYEWTMVEVEP